MASFAQRFFQGPLNHKLTRPVKERIMDHKSYKGGYMNKKRFAVSSVAVFFLLMIVDYIFQKKVLMSLYVATAHLWRPEAEMLQRLPYIYVVYAVTALIFTYIYTKGYEGKPSGAGEGLCFGLIVGFFLSFPMAMMCYVTMPIPKELALGWFASGMVEYLVCGLAVGLIYKKA
jgi:hypothetical protein